MNLINFHSTEPGLASLNGKELPELVVSVIGASKIQNIPDVEVWLSNIQDPVKYERLQAFCVAAHTHQEDNIYAGRPGLSFGSGGRYHIAYDILFYTSVQAELLKMDARTAEFFTEALGKKGGASVLWAQEKYFNGVKKIGQDPEARKWALELIDKVTQDDKPQYRKPICFGILAKYADRFIELAQKPESRNEVERVILRSGNIQGQLYDDPISIFNISCWPIEAIRKNAGASRIYDKLTASQQNEYTVRTAVVRAGSILKIANDPEALSWFNEIIKEAPESLTRILQASTDFIDIAQDERARNFANKIRYYGKSLREFVEKTSDADLEWYAKLVKRESDAVIIEVIMRSPTQFTQQAMEHQDMERHRAKKATQGVRPPADIIATLATEMASATPTTSVGAAAG